MNLEDLSEVASIEEESFARPWSEEALYLDYSQNSSSSFYVLKDDGEICAHVGLWRRQDHVHITTLAVKKSRRRNGLGSTILDFVLKEYPDRDITLEVRKSNKAARSFYRSAGFEVTGSRPDYYTDNGEDALVMSMHRESKESVTGGRL